MEGFEESANMHLEHLQAMRGFLGPDEMPAQNVKRDSAIEFRNPKAKQFFVDGTKIPDGMSCATYTICSTNRWVCS